jgi:hypothetical protein
VPLATDRLAAGLLVRNKEGDGLSTFVDMGVCTRNRCLRKTLGNALCYNGDNNALVDRQA